MPSVTFTATAAQQLVAAPTVANNFIRVLGYQIQGKDSGAVIQLRSATTPKATILTPDSGVGGISCPPTKGDPYFDCNVGEALNLNTGGATGLTLAVNIEYVVLGPSA